MVFSARPVNKSQRCVRGIQQGIAHVVLRGWLVQGLDIKWNPSVDPREAYAPFIHHKSTPDGFPCVAGSGKSIVWLVILRLSSCYSTHLYHKFCDRTTLYAISRRRTGYVSVFLL